MSVQNHIIAATKLTLEPIVRTLLKGSFTIDEFHDIVKAVEHKLPHSEDYWKLPVLTVLELADATILCETVWRLT